ncbi:MAG: oxidoreductase [Bacteroidetes bacterium]|nr:oxidoreductase [Bacteroidota bacterium]
MLKGKVIVVTGGNGLLGKKILEFIRAANGIGISADINNDDTDTLQVYLDITSPESIKECIGIVVEKYGKIDGWVNNAFPRTKDWGVKFEAIPFESWQKNVDMHMNGYFLCCQHILEYMKTKKSGSLINIGSIYGVVAPDFSIYEGTNMTSAGAYAAIKGGIISLSRYLASYYGVHNIRVNSLSPGGIFDHQAESFVKKYEAKPPLKRMGTPEDIAPGIVFLMSDGSSYITGHNLVIDGGWSIV